MLSFVFFFFVLYSFLFRPLLGSILFLAIIMNAKRAIPIPTSRLFCVKKPTELNCHYCNSTTLQSQFEFENVKVRQTDQLHRRLFGVICFDFDQFRLQLDILYFA